MKLAQDPVGTATRAPSEFRKQGVPVQSLRMGAVRQVHEGGVYVHQRDRRVLHRFFSQTGAGDDQGNVDRGLEQRHLVELSVLHSELTVVAGEEYGSGIVQSCVVQGGEYFPHHGIHLGDHGEVNPADRFNRLFGKTVLPVLDSSLVFKNRMVFLLHRRNRHTIFVYPVQIVGRNSEGGMRGPNSDIQEEGRGRLPQPRAGPVYVFPILPVYPDFTAVQDFGFLHPVVGFENAAGPCPRRHTGADRMTSREYVGFPENPRGVSCAVQLVQKGGIVLLEALVVVPAFAVMGELSAPHAGPGGAADRIVGICGSKKHTAAGQGVQVRCRSLHCRVAHAPHDPSVHAVCVDKNNILRSAHTAPLLLRESISSSRKTAS